MRWFYVLVIALACVTSHVSQAQSVPSTAADIQVSPGDRTRRSLSNMAARRRSSLDKNFMRFGRSSNYLRFGRSEEAVDAMRALHCMELLTTLRKLHESERLQKRAAVVSKADKYGRNDNFMRLGRGVRDIEDDVNNIQNDARDLQRAPSVEESKYKPSKNPMYLDDSFLRMGRDLEDTSSEDVIEIDLPDEKY